MFLCGANDLITIFVAPECFSLCSYLLSGYTKKDVRSNEATMKYLLMGGASSSIRRPGLRIYSNSQRIPRILGGMGIVILSTSRGIMTDREARLERIGGEILCYIW
ncbi:hypothetical protein ACS0TY_003645 [Phlomoides rotata]